jgi:hypothetical protein
MRLEFLNLREEARASRIGEGGSQLFSFEKSIAFYRIIMLCTVACCYEVDYHQLQR